MSKNNVLLVAEHFYSIQGEGTYCGSPAVFLRLSGCNLRCTGFSYVDPQTQVHLGCDSKQVWTKANRIPVTELLAQWQAAGWLDKLRAGAHLVITGGEPLLQQAKLLNFLSELDQLVGQQIFIELETNASIVLLPEFLARIDHINASPKLSHSNEPRHKAYDPLALKILADCKKAKFKFVLSKPEDITEVLTDYVQAFQIPPTDIWLMPEGGTRQAIAEKQLWLVELCKKYVMNYSPRLQIDIWDEVVGV